MKSVTEQRAFHAWTEGETLFSRSAFIEVPRFSVFLDALVDTRLLQSEGKNSWQVSPGSFSLNSVAPFEGTHLLLFTSREDAERFLFLALLSF